MSKVLKILEKFTYLGGHSQETPFSRKIRLETGNTYFFKGKVVMVMDFNDEIVLLAKVIRGKPVGDIIKVKINVFYSNISAI